MKLFSSVSSIRLTWLTNRVTRNVIFWLLYTWVHFLDERDNMGRYYVPLFFDIVIVYGTPSYINNLWLIPRFLYRRKYGIYIAMFSALLFLTAATSVYTTALLNKWVPGIDFMGSKPQPLFYHIFPCLWTFMMLAFGKYLADVLASQRQVEELQNQKLQSELQNLKSQINPHFLFNALNTVYGMARRTNLETADAVMKLSDILRYVLYDCDVDSIKLEKEIEHLRQYISFAKLRMHNSQSVQLDVEGLPNGHTIAPLLLMPFIENAFKHGLGKHSQNSWVDIKLNISENWFSFRCANSNHNRHLSPAGGGIGLKNVRRRLELLYPQEHVLNVIDSQEEFIVNLNIKLV